MLVKKLLFTFILLFSLKTNAQVQQILETVKPQKAFEGIPALQKNSLIIFAGLGAPNNVSSFLNFGGLFSGIGISSTTNKQNLGNLMAGADFFIQKNQSIGLMFVYAKANETKEFKVPIVNTVLGTVTGSISVIQIAATYSYHIYTTDKLDPYVRGGIGVNIWKGSYQDKSGNLSQPFSAPTPVNYQGLIGLRYFVNNRIAPYGELSYTSFKFAANLGLTVKIK
jgi:hypothetical protein